MAVGNAAFPESLLKHREPAEALAATVCVAGRESRRPAPAPLSRHCKVRADWTANRFLIAELW